MKQEQLVDYLRNVRRYECVSYRPPINDVCCLWNETEMRCPRMRDGPDAAVRPWYFGETYETLPFTSPASGCHAINGSSAVPEPSVLFKLGAGNKVGHAEMASPWRAI
jgi:hypothetical protein